MASNLGIGITTNAIGFKRKDLGGGPIPPPIPVNLISKKETIMGWNDSDPNIALWQKEGDEVYLAINSSLLYEKVGGGAALNDVFLGEGNYAPNKQYLLQVEWRLEQAQTYRGLAFYIEYTDGTVDQSFGLPADATTKITSYIVTQKYKTVKKISASYGEATSLVHIFNIGLYEYNSPLEAIIPAVIDETPGDLNYVTGGREIIVPTSVSAQNKVNVPLTIPRSNYPYALHIDGIYDLVGQSDEYTINIFENSTVTQVANIVLTKTNRQSVFIVPLTLAAGAYTMHFYSGKQGYSQNRSVKYSGVNVMEWYIPVPLWSPSDADMMKEVMVCWYDTVKQGITNESLRENPVLVDFSGNNDNLKLYEFDWETGSGVGGLQHDFTQDFKIDSKLNYSQLTRQTVEFKPNTGLGGGTYQVLIGKNQYVTGEQVKMTFTISGIEALVGAGLVDYIRIEFGPSIRVRYTTDGKFAFNYIAPYNNSLDIFLYTLAPLDDYPPIKIEQEIEYPMALAFDGVNAHGISSVYSTTGDNDYTVIMGYVPQSLLTNPKVIANLRRNITIQQADKDTIRWYDLSESLYLDLPLDIIGFKRTEAYSPSVNYPNNNTKQNTTADYIYIGEAKGGGLNEKMVLYTFIQYNRNLTRDQIINIWNNMRMSKKGLYNPLAIRHKDRVLLDGGVIPATLKELSDWFDKEGITEADMDGTGEFRTILIEPYYTGYKVATTTSTASATYINKLYNPDQKWDLVQAVEDPTIGGPVLLTSDYKVRADKTKQYNGLMSDGVNMIWEGSDLSVTYQLHSIGDPTLYDNFGTAGVNYTIAISTAVALEGSTILRQGNWLGARYITKDSSISIPGWVTGGSTPWTDDLILTARTYVKDGIVFGQSGDFDLGSIPIEYANEPVPFVRRFYLLTRLATVLGNPGQADISIHKVKFKFKEVPTATATTLSLNSIPEESDDKPVEFNDVFPYVEPKPLTSDEIREIEEQIKLLNSKKDE